MLLSDELLEIISPETTSYVDFSDAKAKKFFEDTFNEEWLSALKEVASEYYNFDDEEYEEFIDNNPNPLTTFVTDTGFRAVFEEPYIIDQWDSRAWSAESDTAIGNTIMAVKKNFPDIEYYGCIQYVCTDTHCGECNKFEINCDKVHQFVADVIELAAVDDFFWQEIKESEEPDEIKKELLRYKEFLSEETIKKINEL